jgi:hypothetical protein
MLGLFKNKFSETLKSISKEIQLLITKNYSDKDNLSEGIIDGEKIIDDYLQSSEKGLAFEHLLYMISETELEITDRLLIKIYKLGKKLNIEREDIEDEIEGLKKIDLQTKTKAKRGIVSHYYFENETIGLSKTLFHKIEIPLTSFNSGLEYETQPIDTIILIDWLNLNLDDPNKLDGISLTTEKGSDEEITVYIGCAHNPCDINKLEFNKIDKDVYSIECELFVDFKHEGVAKNEIFKFDTLIDFNETKSA